MNGILIYQKEDADKNRWFIDELISELGSYDITLSLVYLEDILKAGIENISDVVLAPFSFCINRSRNAAVSYYLDSQNIRQFNPSSIIDIANDKGKTYDFLGQNKIASLPYQTVNLNALYPNGSNSSKTIEKTDGLCFPLVIKPCSGHGGKGVIRVDNLQELYKAADTIRKLWPLETSVVIQKCANNPGRDLRIYILGGKILASVMRTSKDGSLCANFSLGGDCRLHEPTADEKELCDTVITALYNNHMDPDFIGIDFIYDNNMPIFNEIEDAVGSRMLYKLTDINVAKLLSEHIYTDLSVPR